MGVSSSFLCKTKLTDGKMATAGRGGVSGAGLMRAFEEDCLGCLSKWFVVA